VRFYLHRAFELYTPLAPGEAMERIATVVEPRRWLRFGSAAHPFEGTVADSSFDARRIISYRNGFLPRIRGSVWADSTGSRIAVTMTLHPATMVFMFVWVGGVVTFGTGAVIGALRGQVDLPFAFFPIGMLLFMWVIAAGGFTFEARKAERLLRKLFA
jgi:hypothetical protein